MQVSKNQTITGHQHSAAKTNSNKIIWLSIIQGWAILLVVIGHVSAYTYSEADGELYPVSEWIQRLCYAFHMPLFMFVSGGLLYLTRIERSWTTGRLYVDKLKRLLIPFIAFTIIGFLIKLPVAGVTKSGMDISFHGFMMAFFDPANGPLKELWFVGTLMWLMLMYPVYKTLLRTRCGDILLLSVTLVPLVANIHFDFSGWFNLAGVSRYAFYFVGGMLFFKYRCTEWLSTHHWATAMAMLLYIAGVSTGIMPDIVTALAGIIMSFGLASIVSHIYPGLFGSFRDHSFQIYLIGIYPQMFIELFVWRHIHEEWMQIPYYFVSCILALAAGVIVSRQAQRLPSHWIRWCFGAK